jgi:hypothetical protein
MSILIIHTPIPFVMKMAPFRLMLFQLRLRYFKLEFSAIADPSSLPESSPKQLWLKSRYSILIVFFFFYYYYFEQLINNFAFRIA